jgi:hypothetical protein
MLINEGVAAGAVGVRLKQPDGSVHNVAGEQLAKLHLDHEAGDGWIASDVLLLHVDEHTNSIWAGRENYEKGLGRPAEINLADLCRYLDVLRTIEVPAGHRQARSGAPAKWDWGEACGVVVTYVHLEDNGIPATPAPLIKRLMEHFAADGSGGPDETTVRRFVNAALRVLRPNR